MDEHLRLLGILFAARGVMAIATAAFGLLLATGEHAPLVDRLPSFVITIIIVLCYSAIFRGILDLVAGFGVLMKKSWSRILGLIVAAIEILHIPLGTALGVYAFWVLLNPETKRYLNA